MNGRERGPVRGAVCGGTPDAPPGRVEGGVRRPMRARATTAEAVCQRKFPSATFFATAKRGRGPGGRPPPRPVGPATRSPATTPGPLPWPQPGTSATGGPGVGGGAEEAGWRARNLGLGRRSRFRSRSGLSPPRRSVERRRVASAVAVAAALAPPTLSLRPRGLERERQGHSTHGPPLAWACRGSAGGARARSPPSCSAPGCAGAASSRSLFKSRRVSRAPCSCLSTLGPAGRPWPGAWPGRRVGSGAAAGPGDRVPRAPPRARPGEPPSPPAPPPTPRAAKAEEGGGGGRRPPLAARASSPVSHRHSPLLPRTPPHSHPQSTLLKTLACSVSGGEVSFGRGEKRGERSRGVSEEREERQRE